MLKLALYLAAAFALILAVNWYFDRQIDRFEAEIIRLQGEAGKLEAEARVAEIRRLNAKHEAEAVATAEKAKREKLQRERNELAAEIRKLQSEKDSAVNEFQTKLTELETLPLGRLAEAATSNLLAAYPDIQPPPGLVQHEDVFTADVPFVKAAARAGLEVQMLRFSADRDSRIVNNLNEQLSNAVEQIDSHVRENSALRDRCVSCEQALEARIRLEANLQQQLEAQAARVKALERKNLWGKVTRLELFGFSFRDVAIGYGIGRATK